MKGDISSAGVCMVMSGRGLSIHIIHHSLLPIICSTLESTKISFLEKLS